MLFLPLYFQRIITKYRYLIKIFFLKMGTFGHFFIIAITCPKRSENKRLPSEGNKCRKAVLHSLGKQVIPIEFQALPITLHFWHEFAHFFGKFMQINDVHKKILRCSCRYGDVKSNFFSKKKNKPTDYLIQNVQNIIINRIFFFLLCVCVYVLLLYPAGPINPRGPRARWRDVQSQLQLPKF